MGPTVCAPITPNVPDVVSFGPSIATRSIQRAKGSATTALAGSTWCCGFVLANYQWWKKTYNTSPPLDVPICPTQDELDILKRWGCVSHDGTWQAEEIWHLPDVSHDEKPRRNEVYQNDRAGRPDLQGEVDRLNTELQLLENAHNKELQDLKDLHAEIVKTAKIDAAIKVIGVASNLGITNLLLEGLKDILTPG